MRSFCRLRTSAWKPLPGSPSTLACGTRQRSNTSSAVSLHSQPCLRSGRATENPGVPFSTTNIVMSRLRPGSPVLAATQ